MLYYKMNVKQHPINEFLTSEISKKGFKMLTIKTENCIKMAQPFQELYIAFFNAMSFSDRTKIDPCVIFARILLQQFHVAEPDHISKSG